MLYSSLEGTFFVLMEKIGIYCVNNMCTHGLYGRMYV